MYEKKVFVHSLVVFFFNYIMNMKKSYLNFKIIWLSNLLILSVPDEGYCVPDEGYSRNWSSALILISTFLFHHPQTRNNNRIV